MTLILSLRAEYRTDSPFVGTPTPRLSWVVDTDDSNWVQGLVELRFDGHNGSPAHTVSVTGEEHTLVAWPFPPLTDELPHFVEARVRAAEGTWSDWSTPLEVRLAQVPDWQAPFIGLEHPERPAQPALLGRDLDIREELVSAVLHVSALGAARVTINGTPADDSVLGPGFTSYDHRVIHDSMDVLSLLEAGHHRLEIEVTGAWYTEEYGFGPGATRVYGDQPSAALELHLRYADSSTEIIRTDASWEATGDWTIVDSGLYAGETVDLRRAPQIHPLSELARVIDDGRVPVARTTEPVRRTEALSPHSISPIGENGYLLDFGQNLVGRLRITPDGAEGTEIVIRHAEVLDADGSLALGPLRRATATDRFILDGTGPTALEPQGTFHGFRYAQIEGWPGELTADRVQAVVLSSDLRRTGWFESSDPMLNRLHENVVWSMRGNFLSIPTDCPQRDERMGWTGDAQVFAPTASTLFDSHAFLSNWLTDVSFEQQKRNGVVPFVVPDVLRFPVGPTAAWGDAITVIPDVLAERFNDPALMRRHLSDMIAWVDAILPFVDESGIWANRMQLGDWLDPDAPPSAPGASKTAPDLVGTAYLFRSAALVEKWAKRLGEEAPEYRDVAKRFAAVAERTRQAFIQTYVTPAGRMASDAPTGYALALEFGIVTDPEQRQRLGDRLAYLAQKNGFHISTGFVGTPLLLDALTHTGHSDAAERLLLQTEHPSWLYPVTMGATTVWERWDSLLPDGSINPGEMTSFNHYAFGAVADFLYRRLAGIQPVTAGYRRFLFEPLVMQGLDRAHATIDTPSGRIEAGWERVGTRVTYSLRVPAHASATVRLGGSTEEALSLEDLGPGVYEWSFKEQPLPKAPPLSIMSPIREVAANPRALTAIFKTIESFDPELASTVKHRIDWNLHDPLVAGLFDVPPFVIGNIAAALTE